MAAGRPAHRVLGDVDAVTVSADGQRVSWRDGGELVAGTLSGADFSTTVRTAAPPSGDPVAFVGVSVLLRQPSGAGASAARYDVWRPSNGDFTPSWRTISMVPYGELPGGSVLVVRTVIAGSPTPCLALLDVQSNLPTTRTACDLPVVVGTRGSVSPDGRWLLTNARPVGATQKAAESAYVIDLTAVLGVGAADGPSAAPSGKAGAASRVLVTAIRPAGAALVADPAWIGPGTAVHLDDAGEMVRVDTRGLGRRRGDRTVPRSGRPDQPAARGDRRDILTAPAPGDRPVFGPGLGRGPAVASGP